MTIPDLILLDEVSTEAERRTFANWYNNCNYIKAEIINSGLFMEKIELDDFKQSLPEKMLVSVVMEKRPSDHAWVDYTYDAVGIITSNQLQHQQERKIHTQNGIERFIYSGLSVQLFEDECESYYHNLMSPNPGCYVVAGEADDDEMPKPYLVSLSFDEVHAYLEGDEHVYAVEIPPELYKWTEAFVLTRYVAIKKTKRKLKNWKDESRGEAQ